MNPPGVDGPAIAVMAIAGPAHHRRDCSMATTQEGSMTEDQRRAREVLAQFSDRDGHTQTARMLRSVQPLVADDGSLTCIDAMLAFASPRPTAQDESVREDDANLIEQLRRLYRGLEMSAGIMRDRRRTGGWEGAERTADAFARYAATAQSLHGLLSARAALPQSTNEGKA